MTFKSKLILTISFFLILLLCVINPSIVFTPKKERFVIYEPEFYIKSGRMTSLILTSNYKKIIINCAYFRNNNGSFCELYKPRKLIKVEGGYFSSSSLFSRKQYIVVSHIRFEDEKGIVINFSTSDENSNSWWDWIIFPTLLMRYIILIFLAIVFFKVVKKLLNAIEQKAVSSN